MNIQSCISQSEKIIALFDRLLKKLETVKDDSDFRLNKSAPFYSLFHQERDRWRYWLHFLSHADVGKTSWLPWKKKSIQSANEKANKIQKHLDDHQKEIAGIQAEFKEVFSSFSIYESMLKHNPEPELYKKSVVKSLKKLFEVCATIKHLE